MFNKTRLQEILVQYKKDFADFVWSNERYKWIAVQCFQDNWDVNAEDFAEMLEKSLSKTANLLASMNNFPARMILLFAKTSPEEVRAMFLNLFDERKDVYERIKAFKVQADVMLNKYGNGVENHYQRENAISTYLWMRFPDKYYIYKFGEVRAAAKELKSTYQFKKGAYADNIRNFYKFYDELNEELKKDEELGSLLKSKLDDTCYPDPELRTLTADVGFYISRYLKSVDDEFNTKQDQGNVEDGGESGIGDKDPVETIEEYTKDDFLSEVYMTESRYNNLVGILKNKKNIILQGAPGVGKTFTARRLAYSVMGEKDDSRIEFVQFHQNYSYEDFMMGYKPVDDGFELKYGIFYRFCQKAASEPEQDYFFIIDEINRGNMSKIFGELLMLIEKDYRGTTVSLAYNGLPFSVPKNLYIIGMMNTADRSLAMIDYALRRRFSFFDMEPGFDSDGFIQHRESLNSETLDVLVERVKDLNNEIAGDKSLGKGFCIGHSYFCGCDSCTDEWLHSVVEYDILPMLSEYWFDDPTKLQKWENILRGVFQ